ncbi:hypothetical protein HW132_36090 [Brasilonema sp. CT11]|nr:hypothetical protein [Brasilonema sp. CT11]
MERPLRNLYFQSGNLMVADKFLTDLPAPLARISVLFPDPWYKRRHGKRRVIQHDNLNLLARYMAPGSILYFVTGKTSV